MESKNYQEDLSHIRSMMEKGSRFISLSGLSGVFAGVAAVVGATYFHFFLRNQNIKMKADLREMFPAEILQHLLTSAILVLISAILLAVLFTVRKSKQRQLPVYIFLQDKRTRHHCQHSKKSYYPFIQIHHKFTSFKFQYIHIQFYYNPFLFDYNEIFQ